MAALIKFDVDFAAVLAVLTVNGTATRLFECPVGG
jgi:hypothetical protein